MNKTVSTAQKEQIAALRTKWEIQAKEYAKNEIETTIRFHESATRKPLDKAEKQRLIQAAELGAMQAIKAMMPDVMKKILD